MHSEQASPTFSHAAIRQILIGLMLAILLGALDQTIVSVSLPRIAQDLGDPSMLAWVVSGYLVSSTIATPIYGKLGDLYGRRRLLISAILIFLVSSAGCALAQSMPMLIAARVLQGLGGGGLISTAQAIIGDVAPGRERGRYQGYIAVVYAAASVGGPVLGGYLTHYLSWHWIFWINLPLGVAAFWASHGALKALPVPGIRRPIDYVGTALLIAGLSALLIAFTRVGQGVSLLAGDTLGLLAGAVVVLVLFVLHESRTEEPILPLALFRNRTVTVGCLLNFLCFFQVIALSVLVPYGMQMLDRVTGDASALRLIPFTLAVPVAATASGRVMLRTGRYKSLQISGTAMLVLALLLLAWLGPHASFVSEIALTLAGASIGMSMPSSLVAVQSAVAQRELGVATATTALFRSMGGAIGIAILSSVLFALMHHGASADATPAMQPLTAFRLTFLTAALVALLAHALAWAMPDLRLRERTSAQSAAESQAVH